MRVTMYRERSGIWMLQWGGRQAHRLQSAGVKDKDPARVRAAGQGEKSLRDKFGGHAEDRVLDIDPRGG